MSTALLRSIRAMMATSKGELTMEDARLLELVGTDTKVTTTADLAYPEGYTERTVVEETPTYNDDGEVIAVARTEKTIVEPAPQDILPAGSKVTIVRTDDMPGEYVVRVPDGRLAYHVMALHLEES